MSEFTERDLKDIEQIENNDNAVLLKEIKALRAEVQELKGGVVSEKSDEDIRDEIMNIKSVHKRQKAIAENKEVFDRLRAKSRGIGIAIEKKQRGY